jgi:membrane fusion protein (multidrug efflux system)
MKLALFVLHLSGLLLVLPAWAQPPGGKPMALPVRMAIVQQKDLTPSLSAVGSLVANESVVMRPEIAARVTGIHFREGQGVAKGTLLVSLDAADAQAQLTAAQADVNLATQRLERAEELFKKAFISRQALDDARENLTAARARLDQAKVRVDKTQLRAPFTGVLGLRQVSVGAFVQPGQEIVRLEDYASLKLDFRVPEIHLARVGAGQNVNIAVDAFPGQRFSGQIYATESAVDEKSRSILVRARVANPRLQLRPGMFARVEIALEHKGMSLVVPEQAIVPKGNQNLVFRVVDGKAVPTPVALGLRQPGEVEIKQGLQAGDQIVLEGQMKLQPGAPVVDIAQMPAAPPPQKK